MPGNAGQDFQLGRDGDVNLAEERVFGCIQAGSVLLPSMVLGPVWPPGRKYSGWVGPRGS